MKFWSHSHINFTGPTGRFVYVIPPRPGSEPTPKLETHEPVPETREEAIADTEKILAKLRNDMTVSQEIDTLVKIARNENISDGFRGDERGFVKWGLDSLGRAVDGKVNAVFGKDAALTLQNWSDLRTEAYILDTLSDTAKIKFLADYPSDALNLFTDTLSQGNGKTKRRADFFGDIALSQRADFMSLLIPTNGEHQCLEKDGALYARTPNGYLCFSPKNQVGARATIGSATEFTTRTLASLNPFQSRKLDEVKQAHPAFDVVGDNAEMARLESNRRINTYAADSWKNFSDIMINNPVLDEIGFTQNIKTWFEDGGMFRQFLDGNTRLNNLVDNPNGTVFVVPGIGQVGPLDATASPQEYRNQVMQSLELVKQYIEQQMALLQQQMQTETNQEIQKNMMVSLDNLRASIPELFESVDVFLAEEREALTQIQKANSDLITAWLAQVHGAEVSPEQLNSWLTQFDDAINVMAQSGEFSQEEMEAQMGLVLARILGMSESDMSIKLEDNPRLAELLQARVNTLSRKPGVSAVENTIKIAREQMQLKQALLHISGLAPEILVDINFNKPTSEQTQILITRLEAKVKELEMRQPNDGALTADEMALLNYAQAGIPLLKGACNRMKVYTAEHTEAVAAEEVLAKAVTASAEIFVPEANPNFYKTVNTASEYVRHYPAANNGKMPPIKAQDMRNLKEAFSAGATPEQALQVLKLSEDPTYQSLEPERQDLLVGQVSVIPLGSNLVGLTPEGEFLLELPGNNDLIIQDPNTKMLLGQKFANLAEADNLQTQNLALAQIYCATTRGSITSGLGRLMTQSAEKGGSRSMSQMIVQTLNGAYQDPNQLLTPNECFQWEQCGQRMTEEGLTLDEVFVRLGGGRRWDGSVDSSQPIDGAKLVNLLEACMDDSGTGFRDVLGLDQGDLVA